MNNLPVVPHTLRRRTSGWLAALCVGLPLPALAQTSNLDLSRNGVICDRGTRICYDRQGISLLNTRQAFGTRAEQSLLRQYSGRPKPTQFQLSTGQVCNLREQTCWDDGWQKDNVSHWLSKQLFGSGTLQTQPPAANTSWDRYGWNGNPGWYGNQGWNGSGYGAPWGGREPGQAYCDLSQRGRQLFRGSCDLVRRAGADGPSYVVDLRDGRQYAFRNRGGQLVLTDATGIWPVQHGSNGAGGVFRWGDLELVTSRSNDLSPAANLRLNPSASILQDLINNLFR